MERRQIGVVHALFRYPVKSMQGERLTAVEIGTQGVLGDRAYALRESNGRIITAKKWANLLAFSACYDTPPTSEALVPPRLTLPDGRTLHAQEADASTDPVRSRSIRPRSLGMCRWSR